MNADYWVAVAEAEIDVEDAHEEYADLLASYKAEKAAFGDAWPQADFDLAVFRRGIEIAHENLDKLLAIA